MKAYNLTVWPICFSASCFQRALRFSSKAVRKRAENDHRYEQYEFALAAKPRSLHKNVFGNSTQLENQFLNLSPPCQDPEAWAALLDPYLPIDLRIGKATLWESCQNNASTQNVLLILEKARSGYPLSLDLLSYVGIHQKRWDVVTWLAKALLRLDADSLAERKQLENTQITSWPNLEMGLDSLTNCPIWADDIIQSVEATNANLEKLTELELLPEANTKKGTGQVLQSLGCMILQAADQLREEASSSKVITSYVFQILAHMHHTSALPNSIYRYIQAIDPFAIQKPPTLNLLSYRIMTILSDAAWNAHETEIVSAATKTGARYPYKDHDPTRATLQPHVREVSISIWLDLILWCCIEGGWVMEAAWIISEIGRWENEKQLKWSVMKWDSLKKLATAKVSLRLNMEQSIAKSRVNQIAGGIGIAGHGGEPPPIDVPPHTISREVIMALVDGLANLSFNGNSSKAIQEYICICKRLLATDGFDLEPHILNSIIVRMLQSGCVDMMHEPDIVEQILQVAPLSLRGIEKSISLSCGSRAFLDLGITTSAACIGLLHLTLFSNTVLGNLQGALRIFHKLQTSIDDNSKHVLSAFITDLVRQRGRKLDEQSGPAGRADSILLFSTIPVNVLAEFLDLVTHAKLFDLGRWLFYSSDVDGPTIPRELYSEPNLQPAILRFAMATADTQLEARITERLKTPVSLHILRALLHFQVAAGKWRHVEEIFIYLRDRTGTSWRPLDVMQIAKEILRMERDARQPELISKAFALLQKCFSGEFRPLRNQARSSVLPEVQRMNQIFRMLKTCPGRLAQLTSPYSNIIGRPNAQTSIPTSIFNTLLEGVVESNGSAAGKALWDLWCRNPSDHGSTSPRHTRGHADWGESQKVVQPNLLTLQIILRPIIQAGIYVNIAKKHKLEKLSTAQPTMPPEWEHAFGYDALVFPNTNITGNSEGQTAISSNPLIILQTDRDILDWGKKMFEGLGLSSTEIENEIPSYLRQRKGPTEKDNPTVDSLYH